MSVKLLDSPQVIVTTHNCRKRGMKKSSQRSRFIAFCIVFTVLTMTLSRLSIAVGEENGEESSEEASAPTYMSEALRSGIHKVVVLPTTVPASGAVTGSYNKETYGLIDGANKGAEIGTLSKDIGGIPIYFPIPILEYSAMLFGGLSGSAQRRIQDFRDALTEDLVESAGAPLSNDALAADVFWNIRNTATLDPKVLALTTPVPKDTDAILYVSLSGVGINVEDDVATITTVAEAALMRMSDGVHIFEGVVGYEDSDTLSNWTKNDKAAWHAYANYARHYIGREISAEIFERVELNYEINPSKSDGVKQVKKDLWRGVTNSTQPTLVWDLTSTDEIDESSVAYDVEIYSSQELVYYAKDLRSSTHTIEHELPDCDTYRWTVRPSFMLGTERKFGEWMRNSPDGTAARGNVGLAASVAAAYIQDFASLEIKCGRR
jgi:hypothetical protein